MNVRDELDIYTPAEFNQAWLDWYNADHDSLEQEELGFEIARNLPNLLAWLATQRPSPDDIMNRFPSLSSAALRRIADEAEETIKLRGEDGVFA